MRLDSLARNVTRNTLFLALLLLVGAMAGAPSRATAQSGTPDQPVIDEAPIDMPPLVGGSRYPFPIRSTAASDEAGQTAVADELAIDIWYGEDQTFGELGTPQAWLNILGTVSGPQPAASLTYSLNGGPPQPLNIGPDSRRIYGEGDFNIELDPSDLVPAPASNTVTIVADDGQTQAQTTVTVEYVAGTTWPLPYVADWSAASSVTDAGQVVDGLWTLSDGLLQNVFPGYDRLLAIGDVSWTDYEVTVPLTVHSLNTDEWRGPSNGGGVGLIARWPGHYLVADEQPRLGWRHLGALAWYHWSPNGEAGFELRGEGGRVLDTQSNRAIELDTAYIFKLRVESAAQAGDPATYSFKFWEASAPEPSQWLMESAGRAGEPESGSVVLVAHQAEVSFGSVTVLPLGAGLTVTVEPAENGIVEVTPVKASYQPGEVVEFRAVPDPGYAFSGWQGDLTGSDNPVSITLSDSLVVGAAFEPETYRIYISPVASGSVGGLSYTRGDLLAADSAGQWSRVLSAAEGPLGAKSDIEAFAFLPDGSLLLAVSRQLNVDGLGTVLPTDVLRLQPEATGGFTNGVLEWFLDGSDVGLTGSGERIDALAIGADGRLLVSTTGTARVAGEDGQTLVARDEDLIAFVPTATGADTTGSWEMACDGSVVPGLGKEDVVGAAVDPASGVLYLSLSSSFTIGGVKGTSRDVVSIDGCTADAAVRLVWNARDAGFTKTFDALEYVP